jgi:hypothetical protein
MILFEIRKWIGVDTNHGQMKMETLPINGLSSSAK